LKEGKAKLEEEVVGIRSLEGGQILRKSKRVLRKRM